MSDTEVGLPDDSLRTTWPSRARWGISILVAALLVLLAGQWSLRTEHALQANALERALDVHALGLRGEASKYAYLPFTAAQHADIVATLRDPGNPALRERGNRYLEGVNRRAGSEALYVMDAVGMTLVASNWNQPQSFVGQDYANRPYFIDASQGRSGQFYGVGITTGEPGLFLSVPVRDDGAIVGVVAVKVSLGQIQATWKDALDPVMVADAKGIFVLGSVKSWMYQPSRNLSKDDLAWLARHEVYGPRNAFAQVPWAVEQVPGQAGYLLKTRIDGRERRLLAVDAALPQLGWTLTVTSDYGRVVAARNRTWMVGGLGASLLLLGALYWQLRERRYAEQRNARQQLEVRVTERTQQLSDAHAFRKAMEESLLVGMRARDLEGRIIYVNPALCAMTGYRADELMGKLPPYAYWHPEDSEKHMRESDAVLSGDAPATGFESRIRHRNGHDVITMVYSAPLIDGTGQHKGWMSSVVDISARKEAELRETLSRAEAEHAQRLALLGEMASTMAHELSQPLTAMSNNANAAEESAKRGNQAMLLDSLGRIKAQVQRTAGIVRGIKDMARLRTPGMQACAMNEVVANVLALLKPEIRLYRARVTTRLQEDLPLVTGDTVLLGQVLLNLIVNSLQAFAPDTAVPREITIHATSDGSSVRVSVADNGPGVAPAAEAHMFEAFFTTKADGLGLGLKNCRTIVESHQGRLTFEHRAGGGAVFTLHLKANA
jgi:two-component system sensor histidine kinase DctS